MIREWFNAEEAVRFGHELAQQVDRLFPKTTDGKIAKLVKKDQKKFESLVGRTRAFAHANSMNLFKKAKLLNTLKWELRDKGHSETAIREIILLITPLLNRR